MQQLPAQDQQQEAHRDRIEEWKQSVYRVSSRKAEHEVAAQEYASMRAAARHDTNLLSRLPRELHKNIAWQVVHL